MTSATGGGSVARRLVMVPVLVLLSACAAGEPGGAAPVEPATSATAEQPVVPEGVDRVLEVDAEGRAAAPGAVVPTLRNAVERALSISVTTAGGGRVLLARGPSGQGRSLQFPGHRASTPVAAAVVLVRPEGGGDALTPDTRTFRFGARFWLDEESDGTKADNGDNLVQRGLSADDAQYKLQIDKGVPSCLVRGDDGEAFAKASEPVVREAWYEVSCRRGPGGIRLRVERVDGTGTEVVTGARGTTGRLVPDSDVPLSIGGKVSHRGQITLSSTDQFNGRVDDVYLEYPG